MQINRQMKRETGEVWKGPEHRHFCPLWSWYASPSWHGVMYTHLAALQTPYFRAIYEASSGRHDQLLTHSPAFHPSLEGGRGAEISELPIPVVVTSPILKVSLSPPRVTSLLQKMLPSPRKSQGLRSPVSGARVNDQQLV